MQHEHFLLQALMQAQIRKGFTTPNPAVGAVLVKKGKIIATGLHWQAGHEHAEVDVLNKINDTLNATLYVTLEPCCHYGRTPPCTTSIIQKKIKHVVFGQLDPNPTVAGKGASLLNEAGVCCEHYPLKEIATFYQSYCYWHQHKLPFVTAKIAISLDGKIAGIQKQAVAITGSACKRLTHRHRYHSNGILTTACTILNDDPQLNARHEMETIKKPLFIIDSHLSTPLSARVFNTAAYLVFFHNSSCNEKRITALKEKHAICIEVSSTKDGLNIHEVLQHIGRRGIHDLWIEAGGKFFSHCLQQTIVNRAMIYFSNTTLGANAYPIHTATGNGRAAKLAWSDANPDQVLTLDF